MNFLIFRDFSRFFLNFSEFLISKDFPELKIKFLDYLKRASDVGNMGRPINRD